MLERWAFNGNGNGDGDGNISTEFGDRYGLDFLSIWIDQYLDKHNARRTHVEEIVPYNILPTIFLALMFCCQFGCCGVILPDV